MKNVFFSMDIKNISIVILSILLIVGCDSQKQFGAYHIADTRFKGTHTKAELYYYTFLHRRAMFFSTLSFHFKKDSTFNFYPCGRQSFHTGKYQVRQDSIFLTDLDYSILPKLFICLDSNRIIGMRDSVLIKKKYRTIIIICEKDTASTPLR